MNTTILTYDNLIQLYIKILSRYSRIHFLVCFTWNLRNWNIQPKI